jgi:hypothetical protein
MRGNLNLHPLISIWRTQCRTTSLPRITISYHIRSQQGCIMEEIWSEDWLRPGGLWNTRRKQGTRGLMDEMVVPFVSKCAIQLTFVINRKWKFYWSFKQGNLKRSKVQDCCSRDVWIWPYTRIWHICVGRSDQSRPDLQTTTTTTTTTTRRRSVTSRPESLEEQEHLFSLSNT